MVTARVAGLFIFASCGFGQDSSADAIPKYREELKRDPQNSLAHFLLAELFFDQQNFQAAANEFRSALNGDPHPKWIDAWAHIELGEIFDTTGQRNRAANEYRQAVETKNDTEGAQAIAAQLLGEGVQSHDVGLHHVLNPHLRYVKIPKPIVQVPAEYSTEARISELEGTVGFLATVAADGSVKDLRLMEPLGLGLDETAQAAAERWSFEPGASEEGPEPMMAMIELSFLLSSKQSHWHLLRVAFSTPEGAARPRFLTTNYPPGDGISAVAGDDARLIAAMGRQAFVRLSFDVDENGHPTRFRVERASAPVWGNEAIAVVSGWRFAPGSKDSAPESAECTLDLVWAEKQFTQESLVRAREEFGADRRVH